MTGPNFQTIGASKLAARKKKARCWTFHDNLYGAAYVLHRGGTWQEAECNFYHKIGEKWEEDQDYGATAYAMTFFHVKTKSVGLWFASWEDHIDNYASLTHEAIHATNRVLGQSGVPSGGAGTDEAHAYYAAWIVRRCLECLKRR